MCLQELDSCISNQMCFTPHVLPYMSPIHYYLVLQWHSHFAGILNCIQEFVINWKNVNHMLITNLVANGACVSLGTLISVYGKIAQKVYYTICYTYDQFNIKVSNTCILLQEPPGFGGSSNSLPFTVCPPSTFGFTPNPASLSSQFSGLWCMCFCVLQRSISCWHWAVSFPIEIDKDTKRGCPANCMKMRGQWTDGNKGDRGREKGLMDVKTPWFWPFSTVLAKRM